MKDLIFAQCHKWEYEKGITNNPLDTGGATNDGITYKHYLAYCFEVLGIQPTFEHFKNMTQTEIIKFYERVWVRMGCHLIQNQVLAGCVFDFGFNSGNGKRETQEVLQGLGFSIDADNVFGPKTIATLNYAYRAFGADLVDMILIKRLSYVQEVVFKRNNQIAFIQGWFNRVQDWRNFAKKYLPYK